MDSLGACNDTKYFVSTEVLVVQITCLMARKVEFESQPSYVTLTKWPHLCQALLLCNQHPTIQ